MGIVLGLDGQVECLSLACVLACEVGAGRLNLYLLYSEVHSCLLVCW